MPGEPSFSLDIWGGSVTRIEPIPRRKYGVKSGFIMWWLLGRGGESGSEKCKTFSRAI